MFDDDNNQNWYSNCTFDAGFTLDWCFESAKDWLASKICLLSRIERLWGNFPNCHQMMKSIPLWLSHDIDHQSIIDFSPIRTIVIKNMSLQVKDFTCIWRFLEREKKEWLKYYLMEVKDYFTKVDCWLQVRHTLENKLSFGLNGFFLVKRPPTKSVVWRLLWCGFKV